MKVSMRLTMAVTALVLTTGCAASGQATAGGPSLGGPPADSPPPNGPTAGSPPPNGPSATVRPGGRTTGGGPSSESAEPGETCDGTPVLTSAGLAEVRGISQDAELWGLLFAEVPFERGQEVKIVWRMTGEGPLKASASLPSGERAKLAWLEDHGGSNWQRPGYEWGTGWVFPKAGCWKVELSRTRGSGHVWLKVGEPARGAG